MSPRYSVFLAVLSAASVCACTTAPPPRQETTKAFVGSRACRDCHQAVYDRWQTTLMANVVQDPKQHPKAIVADFATPNPLVTFKPEDVDFTYGSKWKQRYWKKQGDDYYVLPAQWDVRHKVWRPYHGVIFSFGVALVDNAYLESLAAVCADERRYEFMFMALPLRIPRGTGSPANPIALL